MGLVLTITDLGRDDLAQAASELEQLMLSGIILTDAVTEGDLHDIRTADQLAGNVLAAVYASGKRLDTGVIQVEGSDNSDNAYEVRTMAITYIGRDQTRRVFAVYTAEEPFIYKVSNTSVLVVAAISIDDSMVDSITFESVTVSTPPATYDALGSVVLAGYESLETPPESDPRRPLVPDVGNVSGAFKNILGDDAFDKDVSIYGSLKVGQRTTSVYVSSGLFSHYEELGSYAAKIPMNDGDEFNLADFDECPCKVGVEECTVYVPTKKDGVRFVAGATAVSNSSGENRAYLHWYGTYGVVSLPFASVPVDVYLTYRRRRGVRLTDVEADSASITSAEAMSLTVGKRVVLSFSPDMFYGTSRHIYKHGIDAYHKDGATLPQLRVNGEVVARSDDNTTSTWTAPSGTMYSLGFTTGQFVADGDLDSTIELEYYENGSTELNGAVSINGVDPTPAVESVIAFGKFLYSYSGDSIVTLKSSKCSLTYDSMMLTVKFEQKDYEGTTPLFVIQTTDTESVAGRHELIAGTESEDGSGYEATIKGFQFAADTYLLVQVF